MMPKSRAILSWSGGKDCMLALERARSTHEIVSLLSVCTEADDKVNMHEIPYTLIKQQAAALGLHSQQLRLPAFPANEVYEQAMAAYLKQQRNAGVNSVIFGDIFLEDLRSYRSERLQSVNMQAVFPLWKYNTRELLTHFIESGWRAIVVCIDGRVLDESWLGRELDAEFLSDLPDGCDPCGENGEFHTFVFDGPLFSSPVEFQRGNTYQAFGYFHFLELESPNG